MDEQRLKENFARVAAHGDRVALFFYSHLFLAHPELRDMFPVSMSAQRDRLLNALGRIVSEVSSANSLVPYLQDLGRDHRKFDVVAGHYPAVGASLLATLEHFSGDAWTGELAADWKAAYGLVSTVMTKAANEDGASRPPWWDAAVIDHERREVDIAVIRVQLGQPLPYVPGQSVAVECEQRPRLWRLYSMANAPRDDATVDFHVRVIDGGQVSGVLGRSMRAGSLLRLGAPLGVLTFDTTSGRDVLMAAGGTGLAPLKAIIEQLSGLPRPPRVHLVFGVRTPRELYDLPDLEKLAASSPWLTVSATVSADRDYPGEQGTIADVIERHGTWRGRDAYVCGSSAMVAGTVRHLTSLGTPREQIHVEDFGWSES